MGSSSKKSTKPVAPQAAPAAPAAQAAAPQPPSMGRSDLPGVGNMDYFSNPGQVPSSGGLVRPTAPPGAMQGAGLNWFVPPPPPPPPPPAPTLAPPPPTRTTLAQAVKPQQQGLYNNRGSNPYTGGRWSR